MLDHVDVCGSSDQCSRVWIFWLSPHKSSSTSTPQHLDPTDVHLGTLLQSNDVYLTWNILQLLASNFYIPIYSFPAPLPGLPPVFSRPPPPAPIGADALPPIIRQRISPPPPPPYQEQEIEPEQDRNQESPDTGYAWYINTWHKSTK